MTHDHQAFARSVECLSRSSGMPQSIRGLCGLSQYHKDNSLTIILAPNLSLKDCTNG